MEFWAKSRHQRNALVVGAFICVLFCASAAPADVSGLVVPGYATPVEIDALMKVNCAEPAVLVTNESKGSVERFCATEEVGKTKKNGKYILIDGKLNRVFGAYMNDEKTGRWVQYEDTFKLSEGAFARGRKTGRWFYASHDGSVELDYRDGRRVVPSKVGCGEGAEEIEIPFASNPRAVAQRWCERGDGVRHGPFAKYYETGKISVKRTY